MNSSSVLWRQAMVIFLFLFALSTAGWSADFTADLVIGTHDMNDTIKIFVKDHYYRLVDVNDDGMTLLVYKSGDTWVLKPGGERFRKLEMTDENFLNPVAAWERQSYDMNGRWIGVDTIDGYECGVYLYNRPGESAIVMKRWMADTLNFVIQQEINDECGIGSLKLFNITEGLLHDSLFAIRACETDLLQAEFGPEAASGAAKTVDTVQTNKELAPAPEADTVTADSSY